MITAGERFARALAAKDSAGLCALLADPVDFQALTPGRHWQAADGRQVAEEIILGQWFGAGDDIVELCSVTTGQVAEREHVAYRVRVRRSGSDYLVEQQDGDATAAADIVIGLIFEAIAALILSIAVAVARLRAARQR